MLRRTKIICTIGPASNDFDTLNAMYEAGMNVARINMSHATHDDAARTIGWIKTLNRKAKYPVPVLIDTQGPEIRTAKLDRPLVLRKGTEVVLIPESGDYKGPVTSSLEVQFEGLKGAVSIGDTIVLDNGLINLRVSDQEPAAIRCAVLDDGEIGSRKHINIPGVHINLPAITPKDRDDVTFGLDLDVDFIAQSFVRSAEDIAKMRELLGDRNHGVHIVAKIENREGAKNIGSIAEAADGIMVARGDLGIETDIATLPNLQRQLVRSSFQSGRRCIVATHLLESMVEHPIPTRAEVTDVANAIYEGVDAVMLSAETSIGEHPVKAVKQLAEIALASERFPDLGFAQELATESDKQNIARSALELAGRISASGIVVITRRGITADLVTNCGPTDVPIFAFSNLSQVRRRLMLNRGVYAHRTAFSNNPEKTIQTALSVLRQREGLHSAERVVVISDVLAAGPVDAIQLRTVGEVSAK